MCVQTVWTILTVLSLQQLLEVLLGLLLHYRLAGADICERRPFSATESRLDVEIQRRAASSADTHAGSAACAPASTLSAPPTRTSSSA